MYRKAVNRQPGSFNPNSQRKGAAIDTASHDRAPDQNSSTPADGRQHNPGIKKRHNNKLKPKSHARTEKSSLSSSRLIVTATFHPPFITSPPPSQSVNRSASYLRRGILFPQRAKKPLGRYTAQIIVLALAQLAHGHVAFLAAAVALHQDAGDYEEEDERERDREADEHDEAAVEVVVWMNEWSVILLLDI